MSEQASGNVQAFAVHDGVGGVRMAQVISRVSATIPGGVARSLTRCVVRKNVVLGLNGPPNENSVSNRGSSGVGVGAEQPGGAIFLGIELPR